MTSEAPAPASAGRDDWRASEPRRTSGRTIRRRSVRARLICEDGSEPATAMCRDSCSIAQSICNNAENICRLADELSGDAWAAGKCADGRKACRKATDMCCGCDEQQ